MELLALEIENDIQEIYRAIDQRALKNQARVLEAFKKARLSDFHLKGSSGYGYSDKGRDLLEEIYASIFCSESALVRGQIVSGTHAIAICLYGILRPGDELLFVQGIPYDTLEAIIGSSEDISGSLKELGVNYRQVELLPDGNIDWVGIKKAINKQTRLAFLQRSCGYQQRPSLNISSIQEVIAFIKKYKSDVVVFVDNCYGEFVEEVEPPAIGADLVAGSLIKNPGGGLAPTGGYVVGKAQYIEAAAVRWTAPGIGKAVGPSLDWQRLFFQGLFMAPHIVAEALKGAVFAARFFERLGYKALPAYDAKRTDLIQSIELGSPEKVIAFCQGIQKASPVDSHVLLEPTKLPGYRHPVVMAAGTFIQGASLELTADAPMREPYAVYLQGGLSKEHVKLAVLSAAREIL